MDLRTRIARWREAKGLSQRQVAALIGVTPAAVYQWEDGSSGITADRLEALVRALGLSMERFYGRVPKRAA